MDTLRWLARLVWGGRDIAEARPDQQQEQQQALDIGNLLPETPEARESGVPVDELDRKTKPIPIPNCRGPRVVVGLEHFRGSDVWGMSDTTAYRGNTPYPYMVNPGHDIGDESDDENDEENDDVIMEPNPLQDYPYADDLKAPQREIVAPPRESLLTEGLRKYRWPVEGEVVEGQNMLSRRQNRIMRELKAEGEKTKIPVCKKPGTMEWRFEGGVLNEPVVPVWTRRSDDGES